MNYIILNNKILLLKCNIRDLIYNKYCNKTIKFNINNKCLEIKLNEFIENPIGFKVNSLDLKNVLKIFITCDKSLEKYIKLFDYVEKLKPLSINELTNEMIENKRKEYINQLKEATEKK